MVSMPAMILRPPKGLEAQHRSGSALDRPVLLLDEVAQVFRLTQLDGQAAVGEQACTAAVLVPLLSIVTFSGAS